MIIYNLFPTLAGSVRDWKPHLTRAASMGFNWIFINPIQFPGRSGSLYSIKDYFRLNPLLVDGADPTASAAESASSPERFHTGTRVSRAVAAGPPFPAVTPSATWVNRNATCGANEPSAADIPAA